MRHNQRQLKRSRLRSFYIRTRSVTKDSEGVPSESYGTAFAVKGEVWPASGKRQIEEYGDRISGISNMRLVGQYDLELEGSVPVIKLLSGSVIRPGDGICILAASDAEPDYKVLTITPYQPALLEIERK